MPCSILYTLPSPLHHLKWVVLRKNLNVEVASYYGNLLHDVLTHTRYLGEEEEGEESGYTTETASEHTTRARVSGWMRLRGGARMITYAFMSCLAVMPW